MSAVYGGPNKLQFGEYNTSIPVYLILTVVTGGIWDLYWNYRQMQACNALVGRQEFNWTTWFLLSIITCGIYHVFYQYQMATVIVEAQQKWGMPIFQSLPVASVLVSLFGGSVIVDCMHQHEINKLVS